MDLKSKVAIVTGGASGIARAVSERLASEGIAVAIVDIKEATETLKTITEAGGRAKSFLCDITSPEAVTATVAKIEKELGPVTILCNIAGLHPDMRLIVDTTYEQWRRMMSVDLDSMFLMCKAVIPSMMKAKWGRIVNFSSAVCDAVVPAGGTTYIVAKIGAVGLTRGLATELGQYFITVNAVAPGTTDTPGARGVNMNSDDPEALLKASAGGQMINKVIQPKNIASAVAYLVSDEAEMMTGQVMHVDGGYTVT